MDKDLRPLRYKDLDLSDRFLVSEDGDIYSLFSKRYLKQILNKSTGYYGTCVSLGSRDKKMFIKTHIAVASTFVDGYKNNLVVNHKDGNKENNNYKNLEWVTQKENAEHALNNGLFSTNKKVKCLNTGQVFVSIQEAAKWCGLSNKGQSLFEYFKKDTRKTAGKHPITKEKLRWELVS